MEASHAPPLLSLYQAIISAGEVITTGLGSFYYYIFEGHHQGLPMPSILVGPAEG